MLYFLYRTWLLFIITFVCINYLLDEIPCFRITGEISWSLHEYSSTCMFF